jgi:mannosyl-oligosaccharide alpha-1,2-mannosidase
MAPLQLFVLGTTILSSVLALPSNTPVEIATDRINKRQYAAQAERAQAVIDTFKLSWAGYYKYAFPNDELKPVTNGFGNSRYATIWRFSYYINLTNLEKQMGRISR